MKPILIYKGDDTIFADLSTADGMVVNAEEGIAHIYIEAEQTKQVELGKYFYDIQVVWPTDDFGHQKVKSIVRGKYIVIGDITRRQWLISYFKV